MWEECRSYTNTTFNGHFNLDIFQWNTWFVENNFVERRTWYLLTYLFSRICFLLIAKTTIYFKKMKLKSHTRSEYIHLYSACTVLAPCSVPLLLRLRLRDKRPQGTKEKHSAESNLLLQTPTNALSHKHTGAYTLKIHACSIHRYAEEHKNWNTKWLSMCIRHQNSNKMEVFS